MVQDIDISGLCKIGRTNNPNRRINNEYGVRLPINIRPIIVRAVDDAVEWEYYFKEVFESKCVAGEWYALSYHDLAFIDKELRDAGFAPSND